MNITSAQYLKVFDTNTIIKATIDGKEWSIPMDKDNAHYAEILRLVHTGQLTIKEAD